MRILRLSAFFVFVVIPCASAQNTQPTPTQQPSAAQAPDKNQVPPQPSTSPNQNSQTGKEQQPVTTAPKPFKFKLFPFKPAPNEKKLPTGFLDRGFRASASPWDHDLQIFDARSLLPRLGVLADPREQPRFLTIDQTGQFDRGIYLEKEISGTGRTCGAILSYNFSQAAPGEMPGLESVTTCTPSEKVVPRRAYGAREKQRTPHLMQTVFTPK